MRTFIGVWLASEMKQELTAEIERLRKNNSRFKWTQPENLHFTLKFLGEMEPTRITALERDLSTVTIGINSFRLQLGKSGCFPPKGEPRIIWIGLNAGSNELKKLAEGVEAACFQNGFPKESKPFQPHLTIARARDGVHPGAISDFLPAREFTSVTDVTGFSLIESRLYSTGPVYHTLTDFPLK
ncbi:MAG TPA: RNA 2',3'-cyclic phosphodiesterase [Bacillota bacterium]|nr:RNA 2',3'-cyclic phosphodiesterase [Bacillota bacterium]